VSRDYDHYSRLLVWAIMRKFEHGMRQWQISDVYGIPMGTIKKWAAMARKREFS
jgi:DNA-binding transcriptional regulator LsrR (DeoR family)